MSRLWVVSLAFTPIVGTFLSRPPLITPLNPEEPQRLPSGRAKPISAAEVKVNMNADGAAVNSAGKLAVTWGEIKFSK